MAAAMIGPKDATRADLIRSTVARHETIQQ